MKRRVLIVEDSTIMRELLAHAVDEIKDVAVDEVPDGVAALKALRAADTPYALVLLDLNLPIMDGMKLLKFLQNEPSFASTVVAVVTTESSDETEQQARALGAKYFLRKPVTRKIVAGVLREVLGG